MKKVLLCFFICVVIAVVLIYSNKDKKSNYDTEPQIANNIIQEENETIESERIIEENMDLVYIKVNDQVLSIELENNEATSKLKERLKSGDVIVEAREYGGFEKVGNLGFSLPREDKNINTVPGDIVLYQGNQISLFYNPSSWSYTKLGKVKDSESHDLKKILGSGDVVLTISLHK